MSLVNESTSRVMDVSPAVAVKLVGVFTSVYVDVAVDEAELPTPLYAVAYLE